MWGAYMNENDFNNINNNQEDNVNQDNTQQEPSASQFIIQQPIMQNVQSQQQTISDYYDDEFVTKTISNNEFNNSQNMEVSAKNIKIKKKKGLFWSVLPTTAVLLGICIGYSIYSWRTLSDSDIVLSENDKVGSEENADKYANPNGPQISTQDTPTINSGENNAETAYQKIADSVVSVKAYTTDTSGHLGSGVIIDESGYIVTNSHVIEDRRDINVSVVLNNGKSYEAQVIGFDSDVDIAILKISADDLLPATFANSDNIKIGQTALAIGSPYGSGFSNSLTQGIISAVDRKLTLSTTVKYIQTDAAINPGNSGGPLINIYGQVIGINTAKISKSGYEGMGFSIPSNTVIEFANQIIKNGYVIGRARIGATIGILKDNNQYGLEYGVEIVEFASTSSFSGTGVEEGDIILEMDGVKLKTVDDIDSVLNNHAPGDEVQILVYKPSTKQTITETIKFISSSLL